MRNEIERYRDATNGLLVLRQLLFLINLALKLQSWPKLCGNLRKNTHAAPFREEIAPPSPPKQCWCYDSYLLVFIQHSRTQHCTGDAGDERNDSTFCI